MAGILKGKSEDFGKLLLRVTVGGLLLFHGASKIVHGVGWLVGLLESTGLPGFIAYGAYIGEVLAPVLLIIGYRARIAALLVAIDLLLAILLVLRHQMFSIKEAGGGWSIELETFFILAALVIFFLGGGRFKVTGKESAWD